MTSPKTFFAVLVERLALTALVTGSFSASAPSRAVAGELRLSGYAAAEIRLFAHEPAFVGQFDGGQASLILSPELRWRGESRKHSLNLVPYLRLDARDDQRSHFDLREASWRYVGGRWELLVGLNKVFWGVTESRHLVDVINQDDAVEDVDGEDKLGQQMIELSFGRDWGTLSIYLLPGFRERTFPGRKGRLRPPLPVDTDDPIYESGAGRGHVDAAIRYSHYLGDWDFGIYAFHGTGREPRLLPNAAGDRLVPHYDIVSQLGSDVQYTHGAWLWKLETIVRQGQGDTFPAFVGGLEYTLYGIAGGAADLGLLFEVLRDGRSDDPSEAPTTVFDDDLFVGTRLALNDVQDTALLLGGIVDRNDGSTALFLEAERRIGAGWKAELEGRAFLGISGQNPLAAFAADDFVTLRLSRYF